MSRQKGTNGAASLSIGANYLSHDKLDQCNQNEESESRLRSVHVDVHGNGISDSVHFKGPGCFRLNSLTLDIVRRARMRACVLRIAKKTVSDCIYP